MEGGAIKATKREPAGRRAAYRLRKSGQVPGIIYGHGEQSTADREHSIELYGSQVIPRVRELIAEQETTPSEVLA